VSFCLLFSCHFATIRKHSRTFGFLLFFFHSLATNLLHLHFSQSLNVHPLFDFRVKFIRLSPWFTSRCSLFAQESLYKKNNVLRTIVQISSFFLFRFVTPQYILQYSSVKFVSFLFLFLQSSNSLPALALAKM